MKKLLALFIPIAMIGASCTQLPEQFVAQPSTSATTEITGSHFVLDIYSNRDEADDLTYHEQLEVWYAPNHAARVDFYSFDEQAKPFLAHRSYYDVTVGQLYMEITAEQLAGDQSIPYIDELVDAPTGNNQEFIHMLLGDILVTNIDWLSAHNTDYAITQRTTDDTGYEQIKTFTIDHITNEIKAVEERNTEDDRPFSRVVVNQRELKKYDPSFFTLDGWRKSLSDPNLPLESEL